MTIETTNFCTIITADKGNIFRSKISGDILTNKLYLGCNDMADNYEEISEEDAKAIQDAENAEKDMEDDINETENGI